MRLLSCPACHSSFEARADSTDHAELHGELMEGTLVCGGCGATFPVTRGIPRFLPKELTAAKQATSEAFGYEWTHYSRLTDADREEFLDWIKPLAPADFADRVVLDAGCGKGRHIFLAAQFQAREVIGIDLSDAVEAAYQNTRHLPNVHVVQADILHLPFANPFDLVYSIGVLHHLPEPREGFLALAKHVTPGGRLSIWVYGKEGNLWIERFVDPVRIHLTSKLPKFVTRLTSFCLSLPLYAALKLVYGPVQRRGLDAWKSRLPYAEYLCSISTYSFAENFWNVFDHLAAPTAFYHTQEEVIDWFAAAELRDVEITRRNNNSWRGTGLQSDAATARIQLPRAYREAVPDR
jgi:SAM-dependent methyltransferase